MGGGANRGLFTVMRRPHCVARIGKNHPQLANLRRRVSKCLTNVSVLFISKRREGKVVYLTLYNIETELHENVVVL